ncbi:hypothetical protein GY15_17125 [Delftia sp. 670]|nr:hypothetical protein GY15_17125 [Delftia sp. 670]
MRSMAGRPVSSPASSIQSAGVAVRPPGPVMPMRWPGWARAAQADPGPASSCSTKSTSIHPLAPSWAIPIARMVYVRMSRRMSPSGRRSRPLADSVGHSGSVTPGCGNSSLTWMWVSCA